MLYRDEQLIRFQDIPVAEHPEWAGKCVTDLKEQQSLLVVAIRRNGAYMFGPELSEKVLPDDVLIGIGPLVK